MKKLLLILLLLNFSIGYAKTIEKTIDIGYSSDKVKMIFGEPDIETEDQEGNLTWIYNSQLPKNDLIEDKVIDNSVFIVKYDKHNCVNMYSYKYNIDKEN